MADFKVGDEVFMRGVLIDDEGEMQVGLIDDGGNMVSFAPAMKDLIPASRVTIAPTRRAAEFPKDWGKVALFSDDGEEWIGAKLVGCDTESESAIWVTELGDWYKLCEVEE